MARVENGRAAGRQKSDLRATLAILNPLNKAAASWVTPLELLESRRMLSVVPATVQHRITLRPAASSSDIEGYTPVQIRNAYGFNNVNFNGVIGDGTGQTIAIVDAYNDPNIKSDLAVFDSQFGVSAPPAFSIVSQTGSSELPTTDAGWAQETSLDVEWAHAIAPNAKILLVETNDDSLSNLIKGVNLARNAAGVSVVSMSWGIDEFSGETAYDKYFTTPVGHAGVTFVSAAGDEGADGGAEWPAASPNVLSVGGTTLNIGSDGSISGESTWADTSGGTSSIEPIPSYQATLGLGARTTADVSYDADPNTGFATFDSLPYEGESGWSETGGTSAGTPQWAALIAIANQGRSKSGYAALDGATGTLPAIYNIYASPTQYAGDFNDITTGSNGAVGGGGFGGGGYGGGGYGGGYGHGGGGDGHHHRGGGWGKSPFGFPFDVTAKTAAKTTRATINSTGSDISITSAAVGYDVPTGVGTPKAAGLIASLVSAGISKAQKAGAPAKVAKAIRLHHAVEVATPPGIAPPASTEISVSRAPESAVGATPIDPARFAHLSESLAAIRSSGINFTQVSAGAGDDATLTVTLQPPLSGYVIESVTTTRSTLEQVEQSIGHALSDVTTLATHAVAANQAVISTLGMPVARAIAPELFSVTHIDAAASFADALSNFADECASLPAVPPPAPHSTTRAWALTGLIIAADAAILMKHKAGQRVAAAAAC